MQVAAVNIWHKNIKRKHLSRSRAFTKTLSIYALPVNWVLLPYNASTFWLARRKQAKIRKSWTVNISFVTKTTFQKNIVLTLKDKIYTIMRFKNVKKLAVFQAQQSTNFIQETLHNWKFCFKNAQGT